MKIAVIGGGISGLSAAYFLTRAHEVWVFEKDERIGGHTHTAKVNSSAGTLPVDTGFIVHNEKTYPLFCRLMRELGVETQRSDMSFGVSSGDGGFEYSSRGLSGFFANKGHLLRPGHYRLLAGIMRFNREAPKFLAGGSHDVTLGEFLARGRYGKAFIDRYLFPMASAVWSMPQEELPEFPALALLRFFHNHGMLGINTHPEWRTIRGGSDQYIAPLTAPYRERLVRNAGITGVRRVSSGVEISFAQREPMMFDQVAFACHGNQILPLLKNATWDETRILSNFRTTRNDVCLHTDEKLLPKRKAAWASWNYRIGDAGRVTMTYHMNRLQTLRTPEQYCVSLNSNEEIGASHRILQVEYRHPVYDRAMIRAQADWSRISGVDRIHYCGAYWFNGFHEDGVRSGLRVAESLGVKW